MLPVIAHVTPHDAPSLWFVFAAGVALGAAVMWLVSWQRGR